jgi:large subunit ribosomal protein L33
MAKGATKAGAVLVRIVSTLSTGAFYVRRKNPKKLPQKLEFMKYDNKARKHCLFVESKQK